MVYLSCTKKLVKDLHVQVEDGSPAEAGQGLLGNWHVNLIRIMRKKCLLFVNDRTLYSFISFDFKRARKDGLGSLFQEGLGMALRAEGLDEGAICRAMDEAAVVRYARATNRSVLGNMNNLAWQYRFHIEERDELSTCPLSAVIMKVNRMPQKNLDWKYSIEVLNELLPDPTMRRSSHSGRSINGCH